MAVANFVELVLTRSSWQEAQKITDALLAKKLVACVEQMEIRSKNWWQGKIENNKEVKLIMTTIAEKYDAIEQEVRQHHSYETFVLAMLPVQKVNEDARRWLEQAI